MRFSPLLLAAACLLLQPTAALASPATLTHQSVAGHGLTAKLAYGAPAKPVYTCPMHPEVTADHAATCPKCKMDLEPQSHRVSLQVTDAKGQAVRHALVRLVLTNAHGMAQGLTLKGDDTYSGAFRLYPGKYQVVAYVKRPADAQAIALPSTYEVK